MRGYLIIGACLFAPTYVQAEDQWVIATSTGVADGVFLSSALTFGEAAPEGEFIALDGVVLSSELGAAPVQVVVPVELPFNLLELEQDVVETEAGPVYVRAVETLISDDIEEVTSTIILLDGVDGPYSVQLHDDPSQLLGVIALAGGFLAVCGGLHVYNMISECSDGGVSIEMTVLGTGLSCDASCSN